MREWNKGKLAEEKGEGVLGRGQGPDWQRLSEVRRNAEQILNASNYDNEHFNFGKDLYKHKFMRLFLGRDASQGSKHPSSRFYSKAEHLQYMCMCTFGCVFVCTYACIY